jgi:hypothetical protein
VGAEIGKNLVGLSTYLDVVKRANMIKREHTREV